MIEIIPAIMTESDEEFVRLVHILERAGVKRVHLDVADGIFVPRRTIKGYEQLRRMTTDLVFDIHLMVSEPEQQCAAWCDIPHASRFLVHVESTKKFHDIHGHAREHGKELGASINPETNHKRLEDVLDDVDLVQFMSVHPGGQGRAFVPEVLDRVTEFHAAHPKVPIMIDGGVTPLTAASCVHAGATHLVAGSFVMRAFDAARALRELEAAVVQ
jgi:ribulose-phosphate 3-epimerase